jgi:hypothetical protein
LSGKA